MPVGKRVTVRVPLNDIAYSSKRGHRVRVAISTTYWPMVWPAPEPVTLRLTTGASVLELPGPRAPAHRREGQVRRHRSRGRRWRRPWSSRRRSPASSSATSVTGAVTVRAEENEGRAVIVDTGVEIGRWVTERLTITEGDPLSAETEMGSVFTYGKGDVADEGVRPLHAAGDADDVAALGRPRRLGGRREDLQPPPGRADPARPRRDRSGSGAPGARRPRRRYRALRSRGRRRGGRRRRLRPHRRDRRRPGRRGGPRPREAGPPLVQHRALRRDDPRGGHAAPAGRRRRRGAGGHGGGHPPEERRRVRPGDDRSTSAGSPPSSSSGWSTRWGSPSRSCTTSSTPPTRSSACTRRRAARAPRSGPTSARAATAHGAQLIEGAGATGLIADGRTARCAGSWWSAPATVERVGARKVILAANGFAANREMLARYCPEMASAYYFGGEGNTGEAIRWGQALGARVAFMDAYQAHASVAVPHGILLTYAVVTEGGIQVNRDGRRFGDETTGYSEHALRVLAQPEGLAWTIYDARLHRLALGFDDYRQALDAGAVASRPDARGAGGRARPSRPGARGDARRVPGGRRGRLARRLRPARLPPAGAAALRRQGHRRASSTRRAGSWWTGPRASSGRTARRSRTCTRAAGRRRASRATARGVLLGQRPPDRARLRPPGRARRGARDPGRARLTAQAMPPMPPPFPARGARALSPARPGSPAPTG